MKKKTITIVALVLIGCIVLFMLFFNKKKTPGTTTQSKSQQNTRRVLPVNAYIVKPNVVSDVYTVNSVMLPSEDVDLSFETSGKITHIYFREGSYVKKGDLLAKVNDARLQAQLKKLQSQLELAKSKEFRQKSLLEKDAISQEAYDESLTSVETTRADIELVNAQIKETELRAPFDGVLGLRQVSEGIYASPSTVVVKITKLSPLKIEFSIPELYVDLIKPGTKVTFKIDGDTTNYNADVYASDSKVDMETHMITVRAYYPNSKNEISPGRYAKVTLHLNHEEEGISVPSESVIPEMGEQVVYTVKNNKAHRTPIHPGLRTASCVQVLGGLNFNDTVITTGIMQLREGIDVSITDIIDL